MTIDVICIRHIVHILYVKGGSTYQLWGFCQPVTTTTKKSTQVGSDCRGIYYLSDQRLVVLGIAAQEVLSSCCAPLSRPHPQVDSRMPPAILGTEISYQRVRDCLIPCLFPRSSPTVSPLISPARTGSCVPSQDDHWWGSTISVTGLDQLQFPLGWGGSLSPEWKSSKHPIDIRIC